MEHCERDQCGWWICDLKVSIGSIIFEYFLINQEYCYINDLFNCWPLGSVNPDMLTQLMLVLLMASSSFQRIDISCFEKKIVWQCDKIFGLLGNLNCGMKVKRFCKKEPRCERWFWCHPKQTFPPRPPRVH